MKLLILGGSRFLGRHLVTSALAHNHDVTLFNRGQHRSTASPNVEAIQGDRNTDLSKLLGRRWDAVIDTCGYLPRTVAASAEFLSEFVDHYVFISSVSVYADFSVKGLDEQAPLDKLTSEQLVEANAVDSSGQTSAVSYGKMYGGLKALCEESAEEVMPNRVLIVRPGLIVGPHDYTDRFTYWVVRVALGGEVLAPGRAERNIQFIDVRDLAEWTIKMVEGRRIGIYNANGLPNTVTMKGLLETCRSVSLSNASFTWVSEEFLFKEKVAAWSELPLWLPESEPRFDGFMLVSIDTALKNGLTFRSLEDTISDTLNWYQSNRAGDVLKSGLTCDQENSLLRKLRDSLECGALSPLS